MVVYAIFSTSTGIGVGKRATEVLEALTVGCAVIAGLDELETGLVTAGMAEVFRGEAALALTVAGGICLKKGRDLFPHPGILTSQPVEIMRSSISIAEKMERLLKVSRKCSFLVSVLIEV
jgi:hypothetical protein